LLAVAPAAAMTSGSTVVVWTARGGSPEAIIGLFVITKDREHEEIEKKILFKSLLNKLMSEPLLFPREQRAARL
jgi:hypothetical protein